MCASLTCSDLTECSARVPAKIPDARLRRERRLARSMERRPTHSIRTQAQMSRRELRGRLRCPLLVPRDRTRERPGRACGFESQQPLAAASWPLWARPMRHFGLLLAILGICVACAEATAACNSYQSIKVLLGRASLPAVARERGKTSAAGRRAWQVRSSWPHHGRCKRA